MRTNLTPDLYRQIIKAPHKLDPILPVGMVHPEWGWHPNCVKCWMEGIKRESGYYKDICPNANTDYFICTQDLDFEGIETWLVSTLVYEVPKIKTSNQLENE